MRAAETVDVGNVAGSDAGGYVIGSQIERGIWIAESVDVLVTVGRSIDVVLLPGIHAPIVARIVAVQVVIRVDVLLADSIGVGRAIRDLAEGNLAAEK